MHDPSTVAFEMHGPRGLFYKWKRERALKRDDGSYGQIKWVDPIATIWHVDPETDGSDDSCGFSRPKLSKRDKAIIKDAVKWDLKFPYFTSPSIAANSVIVDGNYQYHQLPAGEAFAFVAAAWQHIAWKRDGRRGGQNLTAAEISEIISLATCPTDNLRAVLADNEMKAEERMRWFFTRVTRAYLQHHRRWYQHPRWHIRHWKINVHAIQKLKRWLFSRCAECGKGFSWGYSPVSYNWHGKGPQWFKGEPGVCHHECHKLGVVVAATESEAEI
jgi:hypothetical protein